MHLLWQREEEEGAQRGLVCPRVQLLFGVEQANLRAELLPLVRAVEVGVRLRENGEPGYPVTPWSLQSFQAWYARDQLGHGRVGALRLTAAQLLEYNGLPADIKPCAPVAFVPLVEGGPPVALWLYWEFLHREAPSAAHASGAGGVGSSGGADGASSSAAAQPPLPPCRRSRCNMTCAAGRLNNRSAPLQLCPAKDMHLTQSCGYVSCWR